KNPGGLRTNPRVLVPCGFLEGGDSWGGSRTHVPQGGGRSQADGRFRIAKGPGEILHRTRCLRPQFRQRLDGLLADSRDRIGESLCENPERIGRFWRQLRQGACGRFPDPTVLVAKSTPKGWSHLLRGRVELPQ